MELFEVEAGSAVVGRDHDIGDHLVAELCDHEVRDQADVELPEAEATTVVGLRDHQEGDHTIVV